MGGDMEPGRLEGKVTIAPTVLNTIVRLTTLACPGVVRIFHDWRDDVSRILGVQGAGDGIRVQVEGNSVAVDVHVLAAPTVNMLTLGQTVQQEIVRAIQDMVGMVVREVNVHVEDVAEETPGQRRTQCENPSAGQDTGPAGTFRD
jgi:uncharacterized alkaline shock family protein YloU